MRLHRQGREFYVLKIATTPPVSSPWEASFDAGVTWVQGAETPDGWRWLVRGPECSDDPATPSALIAHTIGPIVRASDIPELIIREAPSISLVGCAYGNAIRNSGV